MKHWWCNVISVNNWQPEQTKNRQILESSSPCIFINKINLLVCNFIIFLRVRNIYFILFLFDILLKTSQINGKWHLRYFTLHNQCSNLLLFLINKIKIKIIITCQSKSKFLVNFVYISKCNKTLKQLWIKTWKCFGIKTSISM